MKGQTRALLRKGQQISVNGVARTVVGFSIFASDSYDSGQTRSFNSVGTLISAVSFQDGTQGVFTVTAGGAIAPVVTSLGNAPAIAGARFATFGSPIGNKLGHSAFRAAVVGGGATAANNSAIWADKGRSRLLVARTGVSVPPVPGVARPGVFASLGDPVYNGSDRVAFRGVLKTGVAKVTPANSVGIWANTNASGALVMVARAQDQALMCPTGARFSAFRQLVLPEGGGVVFVADLVPGAGGVNGGNSQGIWSVNSAGTLKLVARTGDGLAVDGVVKTISALTIFNSTPEAGGQTRSFNSVRHLVYKAAFTDGTQGIFETVAP